MSREKGKGRRQCGPGATGGCPPVPSTRIGFCWSLPMDLVALSCGTKKEGAEL
jgi:hypothetical protein